MSLAGARNSSSLRAYLESINNWLAGRRSVSWASPASGAVVNTQYDDGWLDGECFGGGRSDRRIFQPMSTQVCRIRLQGRLCRHAQNPMISFVTGPQLRIGCFLSAKVTPDLILTQLQAATMHERSLLSSSIGISGKATPPLMRPQKVYTPKSRFLRNLTALWV